MAKPVIHRPAADPIKALSKHLQHNTIPVVHQERLYDNYGHLCPQARPEDSPGTREFGVGRGRKR